MSLEGTISTIPSNSTQYSGPQNGKTGEVLHQHTRRKGGGLGLILPCDSSLSIIMECIITSWGKNIFRFYCYFYFIPVLFLYLFLWLNCSFEYSLRKFVFCQFTINFFYIFNYLFLFVMITILQNSFINNIMVILLEIIIKLLKDWSGLLGFNTRFFLKFLFFF